MLKMQSYFSAFNQTLNVKKLISTAIQIEKSEEFHNLQNDKKNLEAEIKRKKKERMTL